MEKNSLIQICGGCGTKVLPTPDGFCPACHHKLEPLAVAVRDNQKRYEPVKLSIDDLEKRIEVKINDLEREKSRLMDDLKVVRQATLISDSLQGEYGNSNRMQEHYPEEPKPGPGF